MATVRVGGIVMQSARGYSASGEPRDEAGNAESDLPGLLEVGELAEAMYEAWNERGAEGLEEFLSDDCEWHDAPDLPDARVVRGREAIRELLHVWEEGGGGLRLKLEPRELTSAGNRWVAVATALLAGDGSGAIMLNDEWCHVGDVRDGKVWRLRNFFSREQAIEAARRAD
jgi:ketosteroid isomerase-like protein